MISVKVKPSDKKGQWEVLESITFRGIRVPRGFLCDGASIPGVFQMIVPKGGRLFAPAVIHDAGYRLPGHTRKFVDQTFLDAMEVNRVPLRNLIYRTVRIFGAFAYKGGK